MDQASYETLQNEVANDLALLSEYNLAVATAKELWTDQVQSYKRNRRNKGLQRVQELMDNRLSLVDLESSVSGGYKSIPKHYSSFKARKELDLASIKNAETLIVLDLGKMPQSLSAALEMLKAGADICHQGPECAMLVKYPTKIKGTTMTAHINAVRKLEDAILTNGLNMEATPNVIYDRSGFHGNDAREGLSRLRLCISDNFETGDSPWFTSSTAANHMIIDECPIVSHKDMKFIPHSDVEHQNETLSPAERASQLGPKAWKHILTKVSCGRSGEADATKRKVIVVDPNPNFGDVLEAVWMLNDVWQKGGDVPLFVGIGFYHPGASDLEKSKSAGMQSYMKGMLLRNWWETSREAGDAEPRRSAETTVQKPTLQKLGWDNATGKAIIPDIVAKRFDDSDPSVREQWAQFCAKTKDSLDNLVSLPSTTSSGQDGERVGIKFNGPEFHSDEVTKPLDLKRDLNRIVEDYNLKEFDMSDVLYTVKPTPKQPGIYITKKKEVMLFVEKEMHGEAFDCPACELFGFGTGALICEATEALQGQKGTNLFCMSHDTDLVVAISQNKTKDLKMICTLVYEAMQIGVPDLAVEHHECKPKTITKQGRDILLHSRLDLAVKKQGVAFVGDRLDDATLAQASLKRGLAGAFFRDDFKGLPSASAGILWEVQVSHNPPPTLKAFKPKYWLLGQLHMVPGRVYHLE